MQASDIAIIVISLAVVQTLLAWWIQARLNASIKHEYDRKLEELKQEHLRKEKAAVVAALLAEWTHIAGADTKQLGSVRISVCEAVSEIGCWVNSISIQAPARPPEAPPPRHPVWHSLAPSFCTPIGGLRESFPVEDRELVHR